MNVLKVITILLILAMGAAGGFIYSGVYDIGADAPHTKPVFWLVEAVRDQSIKSQAAHIQVPKLDDPALLAEGAGHYSAMCTQCHLAPGMDESDIRQGLYPKPPRLSEPSDLMPSEMFWVIKHGVKTTAMPAWGATHDDETIWAIVAFLQKLPNLSAREYEVLTATVSSQEEAHEDHKHGNHAPSHTDDVR